MCCCVVTEFSKEALDLTKQQELTKQIEAQKQMKVGYRFIGIYDHYSFIKPQKQMKVGHRFIGI